MCGVPVPFILLCILHNKNRENEKLKSTDLLVGTKGDWNFRISDLVKNPDGTVI